MRTLTAVLGIGLAACGGSGPSGPDLGIEEPPRTVTLALGAQVTVRGAVIRFDQVRNDSRCPTDVQCVWAGNAEVLLVVGPAAGDGPDYLLVLNTGLEPRSGSRLGLDVTLLRLLPDPISTVPTRDYRAEIHITATPH